MAWIEGDGGSLTKRPDAISVDYLTGFAVGPRQIGDPSQGLLNRVWRVRATLSEVWVSRANDENTAWEAEVLLFSYAGLPIVEVDLAFDQNGAVTVCAERYTGVGTTPEVWLYWLDSRLSAYVFVSVCAGRTPRILLDDPQFVTESDLLLFYVSDPDDAVEFRFERDYYTQVFDTPLVGAAGLFLEEVALAQDRRLHVVYGRHDPEAGQYTVQPLESAPYPAHADDGMLPSGRLQQLSTITYILVYDDLDSVRPSGRLVTLSVIDLLITVSPEGPVYFSLVEASTKPAGTLQSLTKVDLVINYTAFDLESTKPAGRLQTLTLVTYILVADPNQDLLSVSASGRIQSLTIV